MSVAESHEPRAQPNLNHDHDVCNNAGDLGLCVSNFVPAAENTSWPEMVPFNTPTETPSFPVDVLPEPFRTYCREVAESFQVPRDLPACLALGVASIASAKKFKAEVGCTHAEPLNLFILPLMEPGERKSATFREMLQPVEQFQQELCEAAKPAIARAMERRSAEEARLTELKKRAARENDPSQRNVMLDEIESLAADLTVVSAMPRLVCGDATQEKIAGFLHENNGRIAQVDAEGGCLFNLIGGQYSKTGTGNYEVYLRGHAGDFLRVDRMGRAGESVSEPALTLLITGQPSLLRDIPNKEALRGRGLLARFLYCLPPSNVGSRAYANRPIDPEARLAYQQAVRRMLETPGPTTAENPDAYHALRITEEGLDAWTKVHDHTEASLGPDGKLSHMKGWGAKLAGTAARIAGLLHVMGGIKGELIPAATVDEAWTIAEYFTDHALAAFEIIGGAHEEMPRRILAWITRHRRESFKISEVYQDLRRGMPYGGSAEDLRQDIELLASRGYVRATTTEPRQGAGRKPSPVFEVNPSFLENGHE